MALTLLSAASAHASDLKDAVDANDLVRVKALLDAGANPNEPGFAGAPINLAASNGFVEIAVVLIDKGADIESPGPLGRHPLHSAAATGKAEMAALLIARGAKVNSLDSKDSTPLIAAAICPENAGSIETVKVLLAAGANPQWQEKAYQMTALHFAAAKGNVTVLGVLLTAGVEVNIKDGQGLTALHHAVGDGHLDVVSFLIAHGADVNAVASDGETPLKMADEGSKMRELLVSAGAKE